MAEVFSGRIDIIADGQTFAEGPSVDAAGYLYFVDTRAGKLFRVEDDGETRLFAELEGPNGTAFHWNGDIYVADTGGERIARVTPGGEVYTVATTCDGQPFEGTPNDITFHPTGAIYFTAPKNPVGDGHHRPVYRIDPAGDVTKVIDGLQYPNGVNVDADGVHLYVAESCTGEIKIGDIRPDGSIGDLRTFANVADDSVDIVNGADGMCFDVEGNLYAANFRAGKVLRVTPAGQVDLEIRVEGSQVTNCCFGGPDFDQLYITEGTLGRVYRADLGIRGLPLFGP